MSLNRSTRERRRELPPGGRAVIVDLYKRAGAPHCHPRTLTRAPSIRSDNEKARQRHALWRGTNCFDKRIAAPAPRFEERLTATGSAQRGDAHVRAVGPHAY